jgi:hypothetical protein
MLWQGNVKFPGFIKKEPPQSAAYNFYPEAADFPKIDTNYVGYHNP